MGIERRATPRVRDSRRVELELGGSRHPATIMDLSAGGAFVVTSAPLKAGSLVRVRLSPPVVRHATDVSAMVVRSGSTGGEAGFGLMFADLPAKTRDEIGAYVAMKLGNVGGIAARNAKVRRIQNKLRERGARERSANEDKAAPADRPARLLKNRSAEKLPEWARGVDLRELYKDALDSVRRGEEPGVGQPDPKSRRKS
jgi:hypothetical protein